MSMSTSNPRSCVGRPDCRFVSTSGRFWLSLSLRILLQLTAFITQHGKRHFFFTETGHLVIGTLSPKGFTETGRTMLLEPTNNAFGRPVVWCAPAYANKRVYVRNDSEIVAFDMAK